MGGATNQAKSGFTLVEMSIVMVILSLLAGGITLGSDLIHAAELRATIRQVEMFDNGYAAFKLKHGCLPGDCSDVTDRGLGGDFTMKIASNDKTPGTGLISSAYAQTYGILEPTLTIPRAYFNGDGDGLIRLLAGKLESLTTFILLWQSNLIQGMDVKDLRVPLAVNAYAEVTPGQNMKAFWFVNYFSPKSDGSSLIKNAGHYYWPIATLYPGFPGGKAMTVIDTYSIDNKIDNGMPGTGRVLASTSGIIDHSNGPTYSAAVDNGLPGEPFCRNMDNAYNLLPRIEKPVCSMMIAAAGF